VAQHPRVETKESSHVLLRFHRGVELHDEVMALTMLGLMFRRRAREVELAPVLEAADYAVRGEDLLAGNADDFFDIVEVAPPTK